MVHSVPGAALNASDFNRLHCFKGVRLPSGRSVLPIPSSSRATRVWALASTNLAGGAGCGVGAWWGEDEMHACDWWTS